MHRKGFAAQSDINAEGKSNYLVSTAAIVHACQHSAERSLWPAGCRAADGNTQQEVSLHGAR